MKIIQGNNFTGKSFYLKCIAKYPSPEVLAVIAKTNKIERDGRCSIYLNPVPEYSFTGIFETPKSEIFRFKKSDIKQAINRFIQETQLSFLDTSIENISGGQKAITAVLAAINLNPKTLSIDNTLEQLDSNNKVKLLNLITELALPEVLITDNRIKELNINIPVLESYLPLREEYIQKYEFGNISSSNFILEEVEPFSYQVKNLNFSYRNHKVFDNLNLELKSGQAYHFKGKNGSGKSTLAKILCGVLKPDSKSSFFFNNKKINSFSKPSRLVSYCFQEADDQLFGRNVEQEFSFGDYSEMTKRMLIDSFGFMSLLKVHPFDLPLALRKRLSIGLTLSNDRPIYIFDEPTLHLDDSSVLELVNIFNKIIRSGRVLIIISHSNSLISQFHNKIQTIELNE